jgi:hypothetical protein
MNLLSSVKLVYAFRASSLCGSLSLSVSFVLFTSLGTASSSNFRSCCLLACLEPIFPLEFAAQLWLWRPPLRCLPPRAPGSPSPPRRLWPPLALAPAPPRCASCPCSPLASSPAPLAAHVSPSQPRPALLSSLWFCVRSRLAPGS